MKLVELTRKSDGESVMVNTDCDSLQYLEPTGPKKKQTNIVFATGVFLVAEDIATVKKKFK